MNRIKSLMLCFMCLMMLAGCREKQKANNPTDNSTTMPTINPMEATEENPITLPFGEGMGIDLPNVDAGEWDEDEETFPEEGSIQEFQKPSDNGDNDLPAVPGPGWDEDPAVEQTTPPTDTPTTPPSSSLTGNDEDNTTGNTNLDATEPEQQNPTDTPDVVPEITEEPGNDEDQLPGLPDLGWD